MESGLEIENEASSSTLFDSDSDSSAPSSPALLQLSEIFEENDPQTSSLPLCDRFSSVTPLSVPETVRYISFGEPSFFEQLHWRQEFVTIRQNLLNQAQNDFQVNFPTK